VAAAFTPQRVSGAPGVKLPFAFALAIHARLLVALPLLIAAELFVHEWSRNIVRQFLDRGLIAPGDRSQFDGIVESALRLRNSVIMELLLVVVTVAGHWAAESLALNVPAWYGARVNGRWEFTPAGYWMVLISLPLFRFMLLRWYFRLFIWSRFLWQVARLRLRLNTLHPDRAGGLGFLAESVFAFAPVLLAHTVVLSGTIGNRIWEEGAKLADFEVEIVGTILLLVLIVLLTHFLWQSADICEAGRGAGVWPCRQRLCPRVPRKMARRTESRRRAFAWQRRYSITRGPGKQLRNSS
jgi:hypothetical protein